MDISSLPWATIAGTVTPYAPTIGGFLGGAVGGPAGAAIGTAAGKILAGVFGSAATPEDVGRAIAADPGAPEKLKAAEDKYADQLIAQAQVEIERYRQIGETQRTNVSEINATIREEIASGVSWWHWRHLIGYVTVLWGVEFALAGLLIMILAMFRPIDANAAVGSLTALISAITPIFLALCALNGYVAADTTNRVNTALTGQHSAGGILNTVRAAVTKKK